jgi:hypothetical protein
MRISSGDNRNSRSISRQKEKRAKVYSKRKERKHI